MPSNVFASKLKTPGGISYALMEGPYLDFENHGPMTAEAIYQVYDRDVTGFVDELMPSPKFNNGQVRLAPSWKLPTRLGGGRRAFLSADSVSASPLSAISGAPLPSDPLQGDTNTRPVKTYDPYYKVTVKYSTNIDSLYSGDRTSSEPQTFLEPSFSATVELLSIAVNKNVKASPGTGSPGAAVGIKDFSAPVIKVIPISERSYHWAWALNPDFDKIFGLLGSVNSSSLTFIPGAKAETVMFIGLTGKVVYAHAGGTSVVTQWALDYKFAHKQFSEGDQDFGWNHAYNPDSQKFERLFRDQAGVKKPLYESGNLLDLFKAKAA